MGRMRKYPPEFRDQAVALVFDGIRGVSLCFESSRESGWLGGRDWCG